MELETNLKLEQRLHRRWVGVNIFDGLVLLLALGLPLGAATGVYYITAVLFVIRMLSFSFALFRARPVPVPASALGEPSAFDLRARRDAVHLSTRNLFYTRNLTVVHISISITLLIFFDWSPLCWRDRLGLTLSVLMPFLHVTCLKSLEGQMIKTQRKVESEMSLLGHPLLVEKTNEDEPLTPEVKQRRAIQEEVQAKFEIPDDVHYTQLVKLFKPYFWPTKSTPDPDIAPELKRDDIGLHRLACVLVWAIIVVQRITGVITPLLMAAVINSLTTGDWHSAGIYIILRSAITYVRNFLGNARSLLFTKYVQQRAYIEISQAAFTKMHELHVHWHVNKKMGNIVRSMDRGIGAAQQLMTFLFTQIIPLFLEFGAVCAVFFLHFQNKALTSLLFICGFYYIWVTIHISFWRRKLRLEANKLDNKFHDHAADSLLNFETVKLFCNENFEVSRFVRAVKEYQNFGISSQWMQSIGDSIQQALQAVTVATCLVLAAKSIQEGNMNVGEFVAVNTYIANIFGPLNSLGQAYISVIRSLVDVHNLTELLAQEAQVVDAPNATPLPLPMTVRTEHSISCSKGVSVEFRDVSFHYEEQNPLHGLQNVSFVVPPGRTLAIVGATGAGKTSIGRLLIRTYDWKTGDILINGVSLRDVQQKSVRAAIGVVPQDTSLFHDTIRSNIAYGKLDASQEAIVAAAEAAHILPFIEGLSEGWETTVGERGLKLSGGEKQRVAIARCLLKDPPVVLLDEATSALDSLTEQSIQEALGNLGKNRTVVIIAHRLSTICGADEIIVLDKGIVIERGTHEELTALGQVYSQLWNTQSKAMQDPVGLANDEEGTPIRSHHKRRKESRADEAIAAVQGGAAATSMASPASAAPTTPEA